ncbi:hypothetical protein PFISCL1PPCAC_18232, partial [Pristionchus fissidentatus]
ADSSPISMLSLRNSCFMDEISNDSMFSFISTLKPRSIEIYYTRIFEMVQISSERFLEVFANNPNIKYSLSVSYLEDDYGLGFTPSKG